MGTRDLPTEGVAGLLPRRLFLGASVHDVRGLAFETALALVPVGAWLLAGMLGSRPLEAAAHLMIIALLLIVPRAGYLALIPLLPFAHPVPFPPHGPIIAESIAILVSIALRAARGEVTIPRIARPAAWLAAALLIMTVFQTTLGVRALGGSLSLGTLSQLHQVAIILTAFIGGLVFLRPAGVLPAVAAYTASLALVAGVAIVHFVQPRILDRLDVSWMLSPDATGYRASGVIPNANFLGLFLAMGIAWLAVAISWYIARGRAAAVLAGLAVSSVGTVALLLTLSRAAIAAVAGGVLVAVARVSMRLAVGLAVVGIVAAVLVYPIFLDLRLGRTFGSAGQAGEAAQSASDDLRAGQAVAAIEAFLDAPILGHGFGTFQVLSPSYSGQEVLTSAHNAFLKLGAEQGVIGLGLFIALLGAIGLPLWRRRFGPWTGGLAALGALVVFAFSGDVLASAQAVAPGAVLLAAMLVSADAEHDLLSASVDRDDAPSRDVR